MSSPEHERGTSLDTPPVQPMHITFHASFHVQNIPYADLSNQKCLSCMVCGNSLAEIKQQKINWYMERSISRKEPAYITNLRREAYSNALNAGSLLFLAPAVLQAAACDCTKITTTSIRQ